MPYVLYEVKDHIAYITLNRPERMNALGRELGAELREAEANFAADDDAWIGVYTGAGERAFSAGADIHEMARGAEASDPPPHDARRSEYSWHIAACTKPTIGALNGLACGGGALLASSFDIRVGCERSRFRFLAAQYGRVGSTWSLPMQVGWPIAKDLLLTARVVEADEAYRIGLLNYLVPSEQLMDKAMEVAGQVAANDPRMVQGIKELMIKDVGDGWRQMYDNEAEAQAGKLAPTPVLEGFKPFLDRKGRK